MKKEAIILVGGQGTRLRPVLSNCPKPLAPIAGQPFLDYLIKQLDKYVSRIILAAGYLSEQFLERYSTTCQISIESEPLGTGGAVRTACKFVEGDTFWVLNGDSFFDISFSTMEKLHNGFLTIACRQVEDTSRYGSIEIEQGEIKAFREKCERGGPGWINGGIYLMHKAVVIDNPVNTCFSLERELFPSLLLSDKKVMAYPATGDFIDIGTPQSYAQALEVLT